MIETIFGLALVVTLIVPGYLFRNVRSRFFVIEADTHVEDTLLSYFVASLIMLAITWPLYTLFGFDPFGALVDAKDPRAFLTEVSGNPIRWLTQIVVAPVVLAIMWAYAERQTWGAGLFTHLGLPPQPRHPNAIQAAIWAHRKQSPLLEIIVKHGPKIVGRFGPESAATVAKGWPDLFLDAVYHPTSDGGWQLDDQSSGIFIPGSEIRLIQFFRNDPADVEGEPSPIQESDVNPSTDAIA